MNLHTQTLGTGPDVVLLHGWGLHAGVWTDVANALAATGFRVTPIDLPGHGRSDSIDEYTLEHIAAHVARVAPARATWVGWSLGGMVAMHLALEQPQRVAGLVLVASTPQFVRADDWPHAMEVSALESFAQALQYDYAQTLQHFLALQTLSSAQGKDTLWHLRDTVIQHPPQPDALHGGLVILRNTNLRPQLNKITCPVQLIFGQRDKLVPSAAGAAIQMQIPHASLNVISDAGHAPFLSHHEEFMNCVIKFFSEQNES